MRGEVYELRADRHAEGHEQRGRRYAVIVQSDALPLSTVVAAPTSTGSWASVTHPEITVKGTRTKVLVEQLRALDPERRLARKVGQVSTDEQREIDRALTLVSGLF